MGHVEGRPVGRPEGGADLVTTTETEGETAEAEPLAATVDELDTTVDAVPPPEALSL